MQLPVIRAKVSEVLQRGAAGKRYRQVTYALYDDGVHLHVLLAGLSGHGPAVRCLCWAESAVLLLQAWFRLLQAFGSKADRGRWRGGRSARANRFVEHLGKTGAGQRGGGGRCWRGRRDR